MEFKRTVKKIGGSLYLPIPVDLAKEDNIVDGTELIIDPETKSKGKFWAIWKSQKKEVE